MFVNQGVLCTFQVSSPKSSRCCTRHTTSYTLELLRPKPQTLLIMFLSLTLSGLLLIGTKHETLTTKGATLRIVLPGLSLPSETSRRRRPQTPKTLKSQCLNRKIARIAHAEEHGYGRSSNRASTDYIFDKPAPLTLRGGRAKDLAPRVPASASPAS